MKRVSKRRDGSWTMAVFAVCAGVLYYWWTS